MPILGISSIAATAIPVTACSTSSRQIVIETNDTDFVQTTNLYNDLVIVLTAKESNMMVVGVSQVKIGDTVLSSLEYSVTTNKVTIKQEILDKYSGTISISTTLLAKSTVKKLEIKSSPTKDTYNAGEKLDLTGLVITGTCADGSTITIKEGYTSIPAVGEPVPYGTTEIIVMYGDVKVKIPVTVNPAILDSIEVTTKPKTEYTVGETLDLTGMVVTGTYTDGSKKEEDTYTTDPIEGTTLSDEGSKDVTVMVGSKTTKFTIKVNPVTEEYFISFKATAAASLNWTKGESASWLKYSIDGGEWNNLIPGGDVDFGADGETHTLRLQGNLVNSSTNQNHIIISGDTANVTLSGSLMNLLLDNTTGKPATTLPEYAFSNLFGYYQEGNGPIGSTALKNIDETEEPLLPCDTLSAHCYEYMFCGCTNLLDMPELSSTTLTDSCYSHMFYYCEQLTNVHDLPATTLQPSCYENMFCCCRYGLKTAPIMSAQTLADKSCYMMFYECQSMYIYLSSGTGRTLMFTCPETTGLTSPVTQMFSLTEGEGWQYHTPTVGSTYYFQQ